jgi:hypothetical protein
MIISNRVLELGIFVTGSQNICAKSSGVFLCKLVVNKVNVCKRVLA